MSLKEEIVSAIKQPREIAFRLGHKNVKSAMESSAASFIGTRIDANSKFFDRTKISTESGILLHGENKYDIKFQEPDKLRLPPDTIKFFTNGFISYYNYRAIVDNCQDFYAKYEELIYQNPAADIVTLVGDAIAMEGEQASSIKLDLLYLKNHTIGTLNQRTVGFENALFHIFGAYHPDDLQIRAFIEDIKSQFDNPDQQKAMEENIIACFNRANERYGACENINNACHILIEKFGGVGFDDYHQRIDALIQEENDKFPNVDDLLQATTNDYGTYRQNLETLSKFTPVQRDIGSVKSVVKAKIDQLVSPITDLEQKRIESEAKITKCKQDIFLTTNNRDKRELNLELARLESERTVLENKYNAYVAERDGLKIVLAEIEATKPITALAGIKSTAIKTVTVDGHVYQYANEQELNAVVSNCTTQNTTFATSIPQRDAQLISSYSMMLFALDYTKLGGEIVQALEVLERVGKGNSDLDFNSEEIKQAISIANNIATLNQKDYAEGTNTTTVLRNSIQTKIFTILERYEQPIQQEDGSYKIGPGKLDRTMLISQIKLACSDERLPNGDKNPFFGRQKEIFEQMGIAFQDVARTNKHLTTNLIQDTLSHLDPKLANYNFRTQLKKYYEQVGLIPAKKIKIDGLEFTLQEEYKPHTVMAQKPTVEPPPPPPPEKVTKTNFCREMKWALKREMEALNGSIAKGDIKDPNNPDIEFNKHYAELLQKCCAKFEYYASKPDAFEGYQDKLLAKIKSGAALTEEDYLMLRFCPKVNPMLADYKQQLDAAIASGDPNAVRALMVGGKGRGDLMHGNSIFPSPLNEGLKSAILTVHNTSMEGGHFVISPLRADYPELLQGAMGEVASQLKIIMETEDYQKYKDFLTIKIIDGKVTITNDNYVSNGQVYSSNPYDKTSMEDRAPEHPSMDKIPGGEKVCMMDGDKLIETTVDEYRKSPQGDLIQVAPGVFAPQSQIAKINEMAIMGLRTNATIGKINIPKIEIQLDAGLEASAEASSSEAETDAAALREGIVPLEPSTPVDDGIPDADAGK